MTTVNLWELFNPYTHKLLCIRCGNQIGFKKTTDHFPEVACINCGVKPIETDQKSKSCDEGADCEVTNDKEL